MTPKFSPDMRDVIREADTLRQRFARPGECVDVTLALEKMLPEAGFVLDVTDDPLTGPAGEQQHALLDIGARLLRVREAVYDGSCKGNPTDRFTLAHELGHLMRHAEHASTAARFARGEPGSGTSFKVHPVQELEANEFAGTFLLPLEAIDHRTKVHEVIVPYAVSQFAAQATILRTRAAFPDKWRPGS